MRKFSFIFLLAVLPLTLSADDAVSGLVITKTNGERVEVARAAVAAAARASVRPRKATT